MPSVEPSDAHVISVQSSPYVSGILLAARAAQYAGYVYVVIADRKRADGGIYHAEKNNAAPAAVASAALALSVGIKHNARQTRTITAMTIAATSATIPDDLFILHPPVSLSDTILSRNEKTCKRNVVKSV